jgi:hypothetical protein
MSDMTGMNYRIRLREHVWVLRLASFPAPAVRGSSVAHGVTALWALPDQQPHVRCGGRSTGLAMNSRTYIVTGFSNTNGLGVAQIAQMVQGLGGGERPQSAASDSANGANWLKSNTDSRADGLSEKVNP